LRLSIIVPVLNEEARIGESLGRLQPLRKHGHEVIVVDGGSNDATRELAMPGCTRLVRSRAGRAVQMNLGARFAAGEVLLFLHADSELPARAEQEIAAALADGEPGWGWFDVRLTGRAPIFRMIAVLMNIRARLSSICTGDQALFVTSGLFRQVGGFPEIPLMEDIAICGALRKLARPLPLPRSVLTSSRRWEDRGIARTILQMWRLRLLYSFGVDPTRLAALYYPPQYANGGVSHKYPNARILVFARAPKAGKVKSRLAAAIGAESALRLYLAMLRRIFETLDQAALAEVNLWAESEPDHEEFLTLCNAQDIRQQRGANLGARMLHAAAGELAENNVQSVLIIGADCPALTREYLHRALAALAAGADVALGPARDGGYVLIGLRKAEDELFRGVDWGGGEVLQQTLERIRRLKLSHQLLEPLWDVDVVDDLPLLEELRPPLSWTR